MTLGALLMLGLAFLGGPAHALTGVILAAVIFARGAPTKRSRWRLFGLYAAIGVVPIAGLLLLLSFYRNAGLLILGSEAVALVAVGLAAARSSQVAAHPASGSHKSAEETLSCRLCGKPLGIGMSFCPSCGAPRA